jgi:hypothetical protein
MKKRVLLCSLLGVISVCSFSQKKQGVGINTENPQGVFHINGTKENLSQDDFIIDADGKVGIGTLTPQSKLEIIGTKGKGLRVTPPGKITEGEIITSDAEGNFVVSPRPKPDLKVGSIIQIKTALTATSTQAPNLKNTEPYPPGHPDAKPGQEAVKISDTPLKLDAGTWLIQLKYTTRTSNSPNGFGETCGRPAGFDQYIWTLLYDVKGQELLTTVGFAPERVGACASTPQLTHVVKIAPGQEMEVHAYASTSIPHNTVVYVDNDFAGFATGKPYFRAIRLDQFK